MALSKSVLSLESDNEKKCILCERKITQKDKAHALSNKGWDYLKELAQVWKQINIDIEDKFYFFRDFHHKIFNKTEAFGSVHNSCRLPFRTKAEAYLKRYVRILFECQNCLIGASRVTGSASKIDY